MIFVSGIHGVGKSYFCEEVKSRLGFKAYSASTLISEIKNELFKKDKLIADIDENQGHLLAAVKRLDGQEEFYLLDGHLCLLNSQGEVQRINLQTFIDLKPHGILLLTENPAIIAARRKNRDGIDYNKEQIDIFQNEEITYAEEVSLLLGIPLYISKGADDIENAVKFIDSFRRD